MPKAIAVIYSTTEIHFIDQKTSENVDLISEFVIVEEAGPVYFVN